MVVVTEELGVEVERLIAGLNAETIRDPEALRLALKFGALPFGMGLFGGYGFLRPDGEIIETGEVWPEDKSNEEPSRFRRVQAQISAIVWASRRFPSLARFVPNRPPEGVNCRLCLGSGLFGVDVVTRKPAPCVECAGLGWTVPDA